MSVSREIRSFSMFERISRGRSVQPGKVYGAPGDGKGGHISLITALTFIILWSVITGMGWVKPLFLPSPAAVRQKFLLAMTEGVSNSTLIEHTLASLGRVLGAFL